MKKIITYRLKYSDFGRQRDLYCLIRSGDIEVVGELFYNPQDNEIFGRRIESSDLGKVDYDTCVICDGADDLQNVVEELRNLGIPKDVLITTVEELIAPYNSLMTEVQLEVIRVILEASDNQISDKKWLSKQLFNYGFYPFFKLVKNPLHEVRWNKRGILQVPDEFIDFCQFISDLKINKAVEVGVAGGRSSFVMAALLYRNNPNLVYDLVDIADAIVGYDRFKELIPALNKRIPSTSDDFKGQVYDFCFIDADHSYNGMMTDWNNLGQYSSKITVFHDIYGHEYDHLDGGTVRAWQEIKNSNHGRTCKEFSVYKDKWMGLGCLVR